MDSATSIPLRACWNSPQCPLKLLWTASGGNSLPIVFVPCLFTVFQNWMTFLYQLIESPERAAAFPGRFPGDFQRQLSWKRSTSKFYWFFGVVFGEVIRLGEAHRISHLSYPSRSSLAHLTSILHISHLSHLSCTTLIPQLSHLTSLSLPPLLALCLLHTRLAPQEISF